MKVLSLSTHDEKGGAAKAARRLHTALRRSDEIDCSHLLVADKSGSDPHTTGLDNAITCSLRRNIDRLPLKLERHPRVAWDSCAWLPNRKLIAAARDFAPDLIHLHWTQNGFLPLQAIPGLGGNNCPIVWTFHDMWPFCGALHNEHASATQRHPRPYTSSNRTAGHRGLDIDAWVWRRKEKVYRALENQHRPFTAVCPSNWLAGQARASALWNERSLHVIPNLIDTSVFKPIDKSQARNLLNLPQNRIVICFGAMFAAADANKGYRELIEALRLLRFNPNEIHLAVFGMDRPADADDLPYPSSYFGVLHDEISLAALYSAADTVIVPSRQESFGLTAAEAMACGRPVVAFNASGIKEVVVHKETGYLADPFEPASLAHGMEWVLESPPRLESLGHQARSHTEESFSAKTVTTQHIELYRNLLHRAQSRSDDPIVYAQ